MKQTIFLRLTAAVALAGAVKVAGSIVEVDEDLAVNLLNRGKAELATGEAAPEPEAEPDEPADAAPAAPAAPQGDKPAKPEKPAK